MDALVCTRPTNDFRPISCVKTEQGDLEKRREEKKKGAKKKNEWKEERAISFSAGVPG